MISDIVVRQTQLVEKSEVKTSNKTKKSDISKSDKKKSNMTDKGKSSQQK